MFDLMDRLYWMYWEEEKAVREKMQNVKVTRSPLARNSIIGAMRLLTAADPIFEVPHDINDPKAIENSSKIEKFVKAMFLRSGRISGDPIHNDIVRSALLYSEIIIGINSTKDMASMSVVPAVKRRMEDIASKTPYLFEVWTPRNCQSERDKFGITSFHRKVNTTAGHIEDVYGKDGVKALTSTTNKVYKRSDTEILHIFYDLKYMCIWIDSYNLPIKFEEHKLPFIPVVDQTVEGSALFNGTKYYEQEPFLYTLEQTNLVARQNLMLTTLYTMLFSIGANPMFVDYLVNPDDPHMANFEEPGGVIHYRVGERREPMARQVIDPTLMQGWEISQDLEAQSTIYKQTLGEPLGMNAPFSMVALLSQSGRLPLEATQRKSGWAIGEACEIACKWMKAEGITGEANYEALSATISPEDIPENLSINVKLDIKLPTDNLQAANAANMLAQGDDPMVSHRWAQENVLNIGQPEDMQKEIWNEKTANIFFQKFIYQQLAELAQMKQMAMQPGNASGMPGMPGQTGSIGQTPMMPSGPQPQQGMTPEGIPPAEMPIPQAGTPPQPEGTPPIQPITPMAPNKPILPRQRPR
jgi:hypothetical protein